MSTQIFRSAASSTALRQQARLLSLSPSQIPLSASPLNALPASTGFPQITSPICIPIRTLKSIVPVRRNKYNDNPNKPPLEATPQAALERKIRANVLPLRTGVIAIKKGMTAIYDPETGNVQGCTVLQLDRNQVVDVKTRRVHGYWAVVMGAGAKSGGNVTRADLGTFAKAGVAVKRHVAEFKVDGRPSEAAGTGGMNPEEEVKDIVLGGVRIGDTVTADWFRVGQFVDTRSNTKGKGFAGVMKRHGMGGQPASHGVSLTHRSLGSAGGGQGSGSRVHPGKRMAGRMGNERHTIQNLRVLQVDAENGIVVVSGPVSGPKGSRVLLQDALKKDFPEPDPLKPRQKNKRVITEEAISSNPVEATSAVA